MTYLFYQKMGSKVIVLFGLERSRSKSDSAAHCFVILLTLYIFYFLQGYLLYGFPFTPTIFYPCKMPTQPSIPDEPPHYLETCLLCGAHILMLDGGTMSKDHLDVLKESQWEIHRKSPIPEHILVPSTEVVSKSFSKFPWLSSCYQRGGKLTFSWKHLNLKLKVNPSCQICFFLKISSHGNWPSCTSRWSAVPPSKRQKHRTNFWTRGVTTI